MASQPRYLQTMDIDGDYNLDLVVADFAKNEVVWLSNNGNANFTFGGIVADLDDGLYEPRCLESLDLGSSDVSLEDQTYKKPDLLIGSKGEIFAR